MDLAQRAVVRQWHGHRRAVNRLALFEQTGVIASGSRDGTVMLWRDQGPGALGLGGWGGGLSAGGQVGVLKGHELTINALAASTVNAGCLFSGSRDWTVRLWDVEREQEIAQNKIHRNVVSFAAAVPAEPFVLQVVRVRC